MNSRLIARLSLALLLAACGSPPLPSPAMADGGPLPAPALDAGPPAQACPDRADVYVIQPGESVEIEVPEGDVSAAFDLGVAVTTKDAEGRPVRRETLPEAGGTVRLTPNEARVQFANPTAAPNEHVDFVTVRWSGEACLTAPKDGGAPPPDASAASPKERVARAVCPRDVACGGGDVAECVRLGALALGEGCTDEKAAACVRAIQETPCPVVPDICRGCGL